MIPAQAQERVATLERNLDAATRAGDRLRARTIRLSLDILRIWFPGVRACPQ